MGSRTSDCGDTMDQYGMNNAMKENANRICDTNGHTFSISNKSCIRNGSQNPNNRNVGYPRLQSIRNVDIFQT